jgi:WD40 repeat protein
VLWSIDNAHKNGVSALCLSNTNKFLCSGGNEGEVRVWEVRSKEMVSHLKEHIQKVSKVQLFSNDVHLLTTAKDKSILIWDLVKEKRIASYQISMGGVNNFQLSPVDENILVTCGQDRKITNWDLRSPKPVKVISSNPHNKLDQADELFGLAISNDGKYLATGGTKGIIRIYDMNSGLKFIGENPAHSKTINELSYTWDDKFLISAGADSLIMSFSNLNK